MTASPGALAGLKVIDLSRVLGGPYCTQILADHGADVLKIEPPQGDETRGWGPPFDAHGTASYFLGLNRNKRGRTMDLTQPAQREELLRCSKTPTCWSRTSRPARWRSGAWASTRCTARSRAWCTAASAASAPTGRKGGLPGYDAAIQAHGGPDEHQRRGRRRAGVRMGVPVVDIVTGLNAALGIMFALNERERSGKGQFVEAALYDCGLSLLHPHSANHLLDARICRGRSGNAHPNICPYDTFATGGTPIFLAVGNDGQFAKLCEGIGAPRAVERSALRQQRAAQRAPRRTQVAARSRTARASTTAKRWPTA